MPFLGKFFDQYFANTFFPIFRFVPAGEHLECPKNDFPYFFTNENSKEYLSMEQSKALGDSNQHHLSDPVLKGKPSKNCYNSNSNLPTVVSLAVLGTVGVLCIAIAIFIVRRRNMKHAYENGDDKYVAVST